VIWVFMAALVGGIAVLLQAQSARAEDHSGHLGLLATLVRRPRYVAGLGCMFAGFVFGALALRTMPLFAVQAGRSTSLAVTAVLAVLMIGARLKGRDMAAIVAVGLGLVAVSFASRHGHSRLQLEGLGRLLPLVGVLLLLWLGQLLARRREAWVGPVLGVLAGSCFSVVGLCVRALAGSRGLDGTELLTHPLLWTLPLAGFAGLHLSTLALTRASVVAVTSVLIASEVLFAGLIGVTLAGDRARPGLGWLAVAGVLLVLLGALDLARFSAELEGAVDEAS
jgi:drug/metabolite transporter (DMT)-like permease